MGKTIKVKQQGKWVPWDLAKPEKMNPAELKAYAQALKKVKV